MTYRWAIRAFTLLFALAVGYLATQAPVDEAVEALGRELPDIVPELEDSPLPDFFAPETTTTTEPPAPPTTHVHPPTTQPPATSVPHTHPHPPVTKVNTSTVEGRCSYVRQVIASIGGTSARVLCPGSGDSGQGSEHWGVACWPEGAVGPEGPCEYVSINVHRIGSNQGRLKYVAIHEVMHIRHQDGNECATDRRAIAAGADPSHAVYCQ